MIKLTKEQKEELEKNYYKQFSLTSLSDHAEWWIKQIERLEEKTLEQRQYSAQERQEEKCPQCLPKIPCWTHSCIPESVCKNSSDKPEEEECEHGWIKYDKETCLIPFDLCIYCTATRRAEPERVGGVGYDANQLYGSALKDIINQLIKAVNKLNNN